jgi:HPt (histidine-containing phosphotransfer) domain-containing protein
LKEEKEETSASPSSIIPHPSSVRESVFDSAAALTQVEGDRKLLGEMIGLYFTQTQKLLPEIRSAGERGDGKALERAAHKLNGSMGSFGAGRASRAALRLEIMGREGDFVHSVEALASLDKELGHLCEALKTFTKEGEACAS